MRQRYLPREPMPLAQLHSLSRKEPGKYRQLVKSLARERCATLQGSGIDITDEELAQAIFDTIDRLDDSSAVVRR